MTPRPQTIVMSNGSRWGGEAPAAIEELLDVLANYPLRREMFRDEEFVVEGPEMDRIRKEPGWVRFCGNFHNLSHVFNIDTTDLEVIEKLTAAIKTNQQRSDYLAQPPFFDRDLVRVERVRFSETQGEAKLFYGETYLGQFGDDYQIVQGGRWEGKRDSYWIDAVRGLMAKRHAEMTEGVFA